jgi:hypothetical protein
MAWRTSNGDKRFILIGNSQTYHIILSPQEPISQEPDFTYPDLLLQRLQSSGTRVRGYRLSAPNISYMEVLWYLHYILTHPALIPDQLIIQLNFETFRKAGVRDGMLELLKDPAFAAAVMAEASSSAPYAVTFQQDLGRYKELQAKEKGIETGAAAASRTGLSETHGIGSRLETGVRKLLDRSPVFRSRAGLKKDFLDLLYLFRVYGLGITSTTKRSLGGAPLVSNVSSLERIGELCRQNGVRLTLFNAPQNPISPLYRTEQDRRQYRQIISELAKQYAWRYFDFENSIPKDMWGTWIDGPDPIHFGRAGHRKMADVMFTAGLIATSH